jgi:hypothetical protein
LFDKAEHPNLASRVLGLLHRRVSEDWLLRFGNPLVALETFVDPAYFRGTCYNASGWRALGRTKGYGRVRRDYWSATITFRGQRQLPTFVTHIFYSQHPHRYSLVVMDVANKTCSL